MKLVESFTQKFLQTAQAIDSAGRPTRAELTCGVCFYWAYVFHKIYGGQLITLESQKLKGGFAGHAIVYYQGKYYDGHCPAGTSNPHDLGAGTIIRHRSRKGFMLKWKLHQDHYQNKPIFAIMDQVAERIQRKS